MELEKLLDTADHLKAFVLRATLLSNGRSPFVIAMRTDRAWAANEWRQYASVTAGSVARVGSILKLRFLGKPQERAAYFVEARRRARAAEDLFLDPDVGLEPCSGQPGAKHVSIQELDGLLAGSPGRAIGFYQHNFPNCGCKCSLERCGYVNHVVDRIVHSGRGLRAVGFWGGPSSIVFATRCRSREQEIRHALQDVAGEMRIRVW